MVLSWFSGDSTDVPTLIAQRKYKRAVEVLEGQLRQSPGDARLQMLLADVLASCGREPESVPLLLEAADTLAAQGQAAKAIALLKKVQRIDPQRTGIANRIASLIKDKGRPRDTGWNPVGGSQAAGYEPASWGQAFSAEHFDLRDAVDPTARIEAARKASWVPSTHAEEPEAPGAPASVPPPSAEAALVEAVAAEPLPEAPIEVEPEVVPEVEPEAAPAELHENPLFSVFSEAELVAVIGGLRLLTFEPGDIVLTQGEPGDSLFVLTTGTVKTYVRNPEGRGQLFVRQLGEGEFFGEISILSGRPRSATVTAATHCELLELDRATLDGITRDYPHVLTVLEEFYVARASTQEEAMQRSREARGTGA